MKQGRYVRVSNEYIKNIKYSGGSEAFGLYMNLLFNQNWNGELYLSPFIILFLCRRSTQYKGKVLKMLTILKERGLVYFEPGFYKLNDIIHIKIKSPVYPVTEVRCKNQSILSMETSTQPDILLAAHTCLNMAKDNDLQYSTISLKTIAGYLGHTEKTILKAIKELKNEGLVSVFCGRFMPAMKKKLPNRYWAWDFDSFQHKKNNGTIQLPEIQQELDELDSSISQLISSPYNYSPCLLEGQYKKVFLEYHQENSYNKVCIANNLQSVEAIIEAYSGVKALPNPYLVIDVDNRISVNAQKHICLFLKESKIPIVMVTDSLSCGLGVIQKNVKTIFKKGGYAKC